MIELLIIFFIIATLFVKKEDIEKFFRKHWLLIALLIAALLWIKLI